MTREEYLSKFERWVGGSKERKARARAELEQHLDEADEAGELDAAIRRLGNPRTAARDFSTGHATRAAPLARRILAAAIDVAVSVALVTAGLATGTWAATNPRSAIFPEDLAVSSGSETWYMTSIGWVGVTSVVLGALWWVVVVPVLEWRTGRTLGKAALGLRVIAEDGTAPSLGQVVVRRLTLIFSGPLQLFDWAFALFNDRRQRAFDVVAKTVVVTDDAPRAGST